MNRKEFIKTSSIALAGLAGSCAADRSVGKIVKSIRFEMIHTKGSIESRLILAKKAGFDAVEVNSQGYERIEMLKALKQTSMKVVSVYHSDNWTRSVSSLNEKERQAAVNSVLTSIETAELYGADFVHLLPGKEVEQHGEDGEKSLLKSLRQITASLNGKVRILLQNFPGKNFNSPKAMESIFTQVESPFLGLCLDTDTAKENGDLKPWTRLFKKYFSKVDLDESIFADFRGLLVGTQKFQCISLDVSGGKEKRIALLGNQLCNI